MSAIVLMEYGGRSGYGDQYYAVFIEDPDGVKLEVCVCHDLAPGFAGPLLAVRERNDTRSHRFILAGPSPKETLRFIAGELAESLPPTLQSEWRSRQAGVADAPYDNKRKVMNCVSNFLCAMQYAPGPRAGVSPSVRTSLSSLFSVQGRGHWT